MKSPRLKAYIYPLTIRDGVLLNPYINNFMNSLEETFEFLNRDKPSSSGILDLLKYFRKIDFIFLNWPEEIPNKKGAFIQVIFFICMIYYFKLCKVKIVWTLHNKESHNTNNPKLKRTLLLFIVRKADFILTHAKEGVAIAESLTKDRRKKIYFFHHPTLPVKNSDSFQLKEYDILIWGTIAPYKGIDVFLEYIKENNIDNLKILIVGKILTDKLKEKLFSLKNNRTTIIDSFVSADDLAKYVKQSKIVLFTYTPSAVLSSGALMDTLQYAPMIIGPDFGAFRDLKEEGIINTYSNFDDLFRQISILLEIKENRASLIQSFCENNSWKHFGEELSRALLVGK